MSRVKIFVLLAIAEIVNDQTVSGSDTLMCQSYERVSLSKLNFTLYNKQNQQNGILINEQTLHQVNPSLRVIFIIDGWLQTATKSLALGMKDAYFNKTDDVNVILLDWSYYAGINYPLAYCSVPQVGNFAADFIYNLTETPGVSLKNVQLNGFSLGAHVSGFAGQRVLNLTGSKIERINGIEAALEGYLTLPIVKRLDATDANFVQAIHTSNYQFGYPFEYGTVDFHVNYNVLFQCGVQQNGCPINSKISIDKSPLAYIFCNHLRAMLYFTESINSNNFIGVGCNTCSDFGLGKCINFPTTVMGENCPSTASGVRYLNTNSKSPFALGLNGKKNEKMLS